MPTKQIAVAEAADDGPVYHERSQWKHEMRQRHQWRRYYHDFYQRFGDELAFSPGFWVDLWAFLTLEIPTAHLGMIYFAFEFGYIFAFACVLKLAGGLSVVDDDGAAEGAAFEQYVLCSTRAVTTLANFGSYSFASVSRERLSTAGAFILLMEGWFHFIFVCIASSLIIVRALRPLQQVAFSHHCTLSNEKLVLRIRILRPKTTVLIRPEVQLDVCMTSGKFVKLPLVGEGTYAKWSGNPVITITHPLDEESPFFEKRDEEGNTVAKLDGIAHLSCCLIGSDAYGTPIAEVQQYSNCECGFQKMLTEPYMNADEMAPRSRCPSLCGCFRTEEDPRNDHPQILRNAKFDDMMKYGVPTDKEVKEARGHDRVACGLSHPHGSSQSMRLRKGGVETVPKRLTTNSDRFCRIIPMEAELDEKNSNFELHTKALQADKDDEKTDTEAKP